MNICTKAAATLAIAALPFSLTYGYSKPNTYQLDTGNIVFAEQIRFSPHSWAIPKAIELLRDDGYTSEANLAEKYLLPMLEGVTFNDVWGDADLAGGSVLDYYVPDDPGEDYGFGCALAAYAHCTQALAAHPFYGYGNAAEEAQFRYDYAKRIYLGGWGKDPRDRMAGWVIDDIFGQEDPLDGRWASGSANIDNATAPSSQQSRFGTNRTPAMAMQDLFENYTHTQVVFPAQSEDELSTIHVPTYDVIHNHGPEWLDDHFGNADDVEAYSGWDGHDYAVYANWTSDAGGQCGDFIDCAAPMVVRLPVNSKAHAFFQLGWAIHLLEDNTTPVHTINDSIKTAQIHNDIESMADYALYSGSLKLPALNVTDFLQTYNWPPTPHDADCPSKFPTNVSFYFQDRIYADTLPHYADEGIAHAYTRIGAEMAHRFMPYIDCINTEDDHNWGAMGFFTVLGLDNAVKETAGLIRQFIEDSDKTPPTTSVTTPMAATYLHSANLTLNYSEPTDDESGVKTTVITLDGNTTLAGHDLQSGQTIRLLTELPLGTHTFNITSVDNAGNKASQSTTFNVIATSGGLIDELNSFIASGDVNGKLEAASLLLKLKLAAAFQSAHACNAADVVYQLFSLELRLLSGRKISASAAAILSSDAQYVMSHCAAAAR